MNNTIYQQQDNTYIPTPTPNYSEYCFDRLPCGVCRLTNQMCPMVSNKIEITFSATAINGKEQRND